MARRGLITMGILFGISSAPALAQFSNFSENQPGRVYYDCGAATNGAVMWAAFGEDGSILGYEIIAYAHNSKLVVPDPQDGADKKPRFTVKLHWPARVRGKRLNDPQFNAQDVSVTIEYWSRDELLFDRKQFPWTHYLIAHDDNFTFFQDSTARGIYLPVNSPILVTDVKHASYQFYSPLSTLTQWANADGDVTVYKLYIKRRKPVKGGRDALPFGGARRIIYSYRLDVDGLNQWAAQTAQDFVTWQASLTDFKTTCTRQVEIDESQEIII